MTINVVPILASLGEVPPHSPRNFAQTQNRPCILRFSPIPSLSTLTTSPPKHHQSLSLRRPLHRTKSLPSTFSTSIPSVSLAAASSTSGYEAYSDVFHRHRSGFSCGKESTNNIHCRNSDMTSGGIFLVLFVVTSPRFAHIHFISDLSKVGELPETLVLGTTQGCVFRRNEHS